MLSVIIPASNEEGYIADCLTALFASAPVPGGAEAVVVANGCRVPWQQRQRRQVGDWWCWIWRRAVSPMR